MHPRTALDDTFTRSWQVIGSLFALSSVLALDAPLVPRLVGAVAGGACVAWFTLRRRFAAESLAADVVTHAFGVLAPGAFFASIVVVAGPAVALHAKGPTIFFAVTLALSILTLRPRVSLAYGVVGAAYAIVFGFAFFHADVGAVFGRAAIIAGAGVLAWAIARGVANAVDDERSVGRYELGRVIAEGGMGVVYAATYRGAGNFARDAAVKKIHAHLSRDPLFVDAFREEAELGARLRHPNIVNVLDYGCTGRDTWFMAMELVDGWSLDVVMRTARAAKTPLPAAVASSIGDGLLAALDHAHAHPLHVIHRDVAPANVLVSTDGVAKLSDFGIARALGDRPFTVTQAIGHAGHMAPEQIEAHAIDERADLYACAVVLWELVCNRPLFTGRTKAAVILQNALSRTTPPSHVSPDLTAWDAFFARALAANPNDRYASAAEMRTALHAIAPPSHAADVARSLLALPLPSHASAATTSGSTTAAAATYVLTTPTTAA